ncbi:MAG: hypothetical protein DDT20_00689 [Firmicutes bacterium]|nr:hypothetical protein [Bacillota bacterium]
MAINRIFLRSAQISNTEKSVFDRLFDLLDGGPSVIGGVTANAAQLNFNTGAVAGTSVASRTLVLGADRNTDVLALPVGGLRIGAGAGVVTTGSAAEFNSLTAQPASLTTVSTTPAVGSCAVQLSLRDSAAAVLGAAVSGIGYMSNSTGLAIAGVTSIAVLTNGAITQMVAGQVFNFITTTTGLLGATVTAGAGTYFITMSLPNGRLVTSSGIVVN